MSWDILGPHWFTSLTAFTMELLSLALFASKLARPCAATCSGVVGCWAGVV
ncbi:MAG TPA: hypothetical protein VF070_41365 [Streptosporangiaceae bacterium]